MKEEGGIMRKGTAWLVVAVATLVGMSLTLYALSSEATAQETRVEARTEGVDVVMLRCGTGGATFSVQAYQGSPAAPSKKSDSCPETLSLLRRDGFTLSTVGYNDEDGDFVVFTLMR
jgi:hypothetical protein